MDRLEMMDLEQNEANEKLEISFLNYKVWCVLIDKDNYVDQCREVYGLMESTAKEEWGNDTVLTAFGKERMVIVENLVLKRRMAFVNGCERRELKL